MEVCLAWVPRLGRRVGEPLALPSSGASLDQRLSGILSILLSRRIQLVQEWGKYRGQTHRMVGKMLSAKSCNPLPALSQLRPGSRQTRLQ